MLFMHCSLQKEGTATPSMTSKLLEAYEANDPVLLNETLIPAVTATAYAGASDTVVRHAWGILRFY